MRIITISSLKGGVGKTTLAAFLGQACSARGISVLSVDLDHNNNLTDFYFRDDEDVAKAEAANVRDFLAGHAGLTEVAHQTPLGWVIPATPGLATIGLELARNPMSVMRLRTAIRKLDVDVVIIDTPPALTLELSAGLYAADLVLVPVSAARWTVQGYQVIEDEVRRVDESGSTVPKMLAVPSMVTQTEADVMRAAGLWTATRTAIHRDASVRAAATEGRRLRDGTLAAGWFDRLAEEVVG